MSKIIAFCENLLTERGTTTAIFDYAYYNEKLLGNKSIIIYYNDQNNIQTVVNKFKKYFSIYCINNFSEIEQILEENNCDILYMIKYGVNDQKISKKVKTVVHCVFDCSQPHGNVYASISPILSKNLPCVPHMINLPNHDKNMRKKLNIPENAVVFGRHGGYYQFDIPYVHNIVYIFAKNNPDKYFIFVNTHKFCDSLPNIIHLDKIIDLEEKVEFIQTCDAMIWGRSDGETFGLSIGEFSIKNKPIICTKTGYLNHVNILKDKALWYNHFNLYQILHNFDRNEESKKDWNAYKEYTPENVMNIFEKVFIK